MVRKPTARLGSGSPPLARVVSALVLFVSLVSADPASSALAATRATQCPTARFDSLVSAVGASAIGSCVGSEYTSPSDGSIVQRTTGGLLATNSKGDWVSFTDGASTWVLSGGSVQKLSSAVTPDTASHYKTTQTQPRIATTSGSPFGATQTHPGKAVFKPSSSALDAFMKSATPARAALAALPLVYHGGAVERLNTVDFAIYWMPPGSTTSPQYQSLLNRFFGDVNASSLYGIATQYSDGGGQIQNTSRFGGTWVDTSALPESPLLDIDIENEVLNAINTNNWNPAGVNANYFVFTPSGVVSCFDGTQQDCSNTTFCAYHSSFTASNNAGTVSVRYANMPFEQPADCGHVSTPNGDAFADTAIDDTSHELMEAVTDPDLNAWYDSNGNEMADKCIVYGPPLNAAGADVIMNGHSYLVQEEWSNAASGCVLSLNPPPNVTLTLSLPGTGLGTVTSSPAGISCPATCSAPFQQGTFVTLTATPSAGSTFAGWTGPCSGTGTCNVTMSAAQTVSAVFNVAPVCTPRPPVHVTASKGAGQLNVTVATQGTGVTLLSIAFPVASNGIIHFPGLPVGPGPIQSQLTPGTTSVSFFVTRSVAGVAVQVPFTVSDSCGLWPTFVGAGAAAF